MTSTGGHWPSAARRPLMLSALGDRLVLPPALLLRRSWFWDKFLTLRMTSTLLVPVLLCSAWVMVKSTTLFSLTSNPAFTMDTLNGMETEDPKQVSTVPLDPDLGTTETDPVTGGGSQESSQTSAASPATFPFNNTADGVENSVSLQELKSSPAGPKDPINLELFTTTNPFIVAKEEAETKAISLPLRGADKGTASDHHVASFFNIPKENGTAEKQCSCNTPGPEGQKGDQGERGDSGEPGLVGKRGIQGIEGLKGELGYKGEKGDQGFKGDIGGPGPSGQKGEPGGPCPSCPKGQRGDKGETGSPGSMGLSGPKGDKGVSGMPGPKGETGLEGNLGQKGSKGHKGESGEIGEMGPKGTAGLPGPYGPKGPKGDPGIPGRVGPPGNYGPPGIPGRKGEKGQKCDCVEPEDTAFSVGLLRQRSFPLPGSPVRFEKVFLNEKKVYDMKLGVFTANNAGIYSFNYHLSVSNKPLRIALFHNSKIILQTLTRPAEHQVHVISPMYALNLS